MRPTPHLLPLLAALAATPVAAQSLVLEGEVPDGREAFFSLPFEVPPGTRELQVTHGDLSDANILDWGLWGPDGFRGWGGGNTEPVVITDRAASRSYLPGPVGAGRWEVVVGKAKLVEAPARYRVELTFRDSPTLPPQPERRPYSPAPALETGWRWYAGDFHVHSRESGDARPSLDTIATFARSRGLDFVELSDHNTISHVDLIPDAQSRHPTLLLLPGVEFTTYAGHANGIGATRHVDHRLDLDGGTMADVSEAFAAQEALLSINHPALDLGDLCIGCRWEWPLEGVELAAVELGTGAYSKGGFLFLDRTLAFWEARLREGRRVAAIGGSDDHRGGVAGDALHSPIGSPTTLVYARELSHAAILEAVRAGRTVVKLEGPDDPMVELTAGEALLGDTVRADRVTLSGKVNGGQGHQVRWVRNGEPEVAVAIDADPFLLTREVEAPAPPLEHRYRLEVLVDGVPRTITSHLYVAAPLPDAGIAPPPPPPDAVGCACSGTWAGLPLTAALSLLLLARRRR